VNKKAQSGEMMIILWFFFLLSLIGLGIATGSYLFFGQEYEFRQIEADILNNKISECFLDNNIDTDEIETQLYSVCAINKNVIDKEYSILILLDDIEIYDFHYDKTQCALSDLNKYFSKCSSSTIIKNNLKYTILTGSNQLVSEGIAATKVFGEGGAAGGGGG